MSTWNPFNSSTEPETPRHPLPPACPTAPNQPPSARVAAHLAFTPDPAQARFLDATQKRTGRSPSAVREFLQ